MPAQSLSDRIAWSLRHSQRYGLAPTSEVLADWLKMAHRLESQAREQESIADQHRIELWKKYGKGNPPAHIQAAIDREQVRLLKTEEISERPEFPIYVGYAGREHGEF